MSTKHTRGPWVFGWSETDGLTGARCAPTVYLNKADLAVEIPIHQGGRPIAWVLSSLPDERAVPDARLIAAAPELLEALQRIEKRIAYYASMAAGDAPNIEQWAYTDQSGDMAIVRAAICKAIGEQA